MNLPYLLSKLDDIYLYRFSDNLNVVGVNADSTEFFGFDDNFTFIRRPCEVGWAESGEGIKIIPLNFGLSPRIEDFRFERNRLMIQSMMPHGGFSITPKFKAHYLHSILSPEHFQYIIKNAKPGQIETN